MHICEPWFIIPAQVKVGHQTLSTHITSNHFISIWIPSSHTKKYEKQTFSRLLLRLMFRNKNLTTTNIELRIPGIPFATPRCAQFYVFFGRFEFISKQMSETIAIGIIHMSHAKKTTSNFPSNPGCLIPGPLFDGLWNNPYIVGQDFIPNKSPKTTRGRTCTCSGGRAVWWPWSMTLYITYDFRNRQYTNIESMYKCVLFI